MALALLLKNSWDVNEVIKQMGTKVFQQTQTKYLQNTFNFNRDEAAETIAENRAEEEFMCTCCYCDYEVSEAVEMIDCGHRLCSYCFQGYCQAKVAEGADCVFAPCPD